MQRMGPSGRGFVLSPDGDSFCQFGGGTLTASEGSLVWSFSFASGKLVDTAKPTVQCSTGLQTQWEHWVVKIFVKSCFVF